MFSDLCSDAIEEVHDVFDNKCKEVISYIQTNGEGFLMILILAKLNHQLKPWVSAEKIPGGGDPIIANFVHRYGLSHQQIICFPIEI